MPYQVNDRPFEGRIVYDDSVQRKRPVVFMQPDWKGVCADMVAQASSVAAKDYVVLMAEMFRAGYGGTPKTREQLAAGMKAVHNDLAFTLTCGEKPSDHAERALGHVTPGVRTVYDRHGYHAEMQRAFEALAMQIQQILNSQDDVTQMTARHARTR
jgi:hypothetical protein